MNRRYVTEHATGWQVRMPERAGGKSRFFRHPSDPGAIAPKAISLKDACSWRDAQLKKYDQTLVSRTTCDPTAGVNRDKVYAIATWMHEDKQVKRMFQIKTWGKELAMTIAHMARDIGVRLENERINRGA